MPATLVVRLVGLLLVSNQILPDGGFGAIAPRIPCPTRMEQKADKNIELLDMTAEEAMNAVGVEEHVAMLVIPKKDYLANVGWKPSTLETMPDHYYVKLNGERIRFISTASGGKTQQASTRVMRGRLSTESRAQPDIELGVPHIQQSCCADPTLRPEYLFPTYRLDAAVFDFSNGSPRACALSGGRIDTVVDIDNEGAVIIEATIEEGKKSITVRGTAQLLATNLPTDSMTGIRTCKANHAHNAAYAAMLLPCRRIVACPTRTPKVESCETIVMLRANDPPRREITPVPRRFYQRVDAQCSNTQWP